MLPKITSYAPSRKNISNSEKNTEQKLAEKFLEKAKRIYCQKHKLEPKNVYEHLFSFINSKILYEIELAKRKKTFSDEKKLCSVQNYQEIYSEFSKKLLKIFQKNNSNSNQKPFDEFTFVKQINGLHIFETISKIKRKQENSEFKLRVYDFDESVKEKIIEQRNKVKFDAEIKKILEKHNHDNINNPFKHLKFTAQEADSCASDHYSKNAYLASLNFNFNNPVD